MNMHLNSDYEPVNGPILAEVEARLTDLKAIIPDLAIELSLPAVSLHQLLAMTGRAGKQVRIDHFNLPIPVQSHLDHIHALGAIADVVCASYSLTSVQSGMVASAIGYHDLSEIVTLDIPTFTAPELKHHLPPALLTLSHDEATEFIRLSFPEHLRQQFDESIRMISSHDELAARVFEFCDKIEPILAVWRYVRCYRDQIELHPFLEAMSDFFSNPGVEKACFDESQREAARFLQSRENAAIYFKYGAAGFQWDSQAGIVSKLINQVVERLDVGTI